MCPRPSADVRIRIQIKWPQNVVCRYFIRENIAQPWLPDPSSFCTNPDIFLFLFKIHKRIGHYNLPYKPWTWLIIWNQLCKHCLMDTSSFHRHAHMNTAEWHVFRRSSSLRLLILPKSLIASSWMLSTNCPSATSTKAKTIDEHAIRAQPASATQNMQHISARVMDKCLTHSNLILRFNDIRGCD